MLDETKARKKKNRSSNSIQACDKPRFSIFSSLTYRCAPFKRQIKNKKGKEKKRKNWSHFYLFFYQRRISISGELDRTGYTGYIMKITRMSFDTHVKIARNIYFI